MRAGVIALALVACSLSREASAGNDESVFLGNQAAMSGGAVVAWVHDGGAPWYNPSGLAKIDRTSVDLSASAFTLRHYELPDAARTVEATGLRSEDASFTEVVSVPAAFTLMRSLDDGVAGALSVFVPDAEDILTGTSYGSAPGAIPGAAYQWTFSASRRVARYFVGPSIGFEIGQGFRLGFSGFLSYESRTRSRDFHSQLAAVDGTQAVISVDRKTESSLFGTAWVVGWSWDIDERWSLGMAIRTPVHHAGGQIEDIEAVGVSRVGAADPEVSSRIDDRGLDPSVFDRMEPGRGDFGVAYRVADGILSGQVELRSAATGDGILRRPVVNGRVGATFRLGESFSLGGGLFTDHSPSAAPRELGETQVDFYGGAIGGQYRTDLEVDDEGKPKGLVLSTTIALRYAYGAGSMGSLTADPRSTPAGAVADVTIHEAGLHIGSSVDF